MRKFGIFKNAKFYQYFLRFLPYSSKPCTGRYSDAQNSTVIVQDLKE